MHAARRLYLYVMSGITLGVIAFGLVVLLRVLLRDVFPNPYGDLSDGYDNSREQLSQAIAMLGVAGPVWAVHWWLVQRGLREGRPERDEERGAGIRGIYLTGVLLISLLVWVLSAISVLQWAATNLLNANPDYAFSDPLGAATAGLAGFVIWLYHGLVRRRDLAAGPVSGTAAWVPRLYLYGVSVGALLVAVTTFGSIVVSLLFANDIVGDGIDGSGYATYSLVQQVVTAIAWAMVWLGHWAYANRMIHHPDWRGVEERVSRTRVAAFVVVIVAAAIGALGDIAAAASAVLRAVVPNQAFQTDLEMSFVAAPLVLAALWFVVWFVHVRWLRSEPAAADPVRARQQERLVSHSVAALGLAMGAFGAGWLVGYLIDRVFGEAQTAFDDSSFGITQFLPIGVVGLGAWLWFWRAVVARRRTDPVDEANSTIRRTFLYMTLGVALVVAIAAAAATLYGLVGSVLNAGFGGNLLSELSAPIGALLVAGIVLLYHGLALRSDQRLATPPVSDMPAIESTVVEDPAQGPAPVADAATPSAPVASSGAILVAIHKRAFDLVGPEDELDTALVAARAALPPGVEIIEAKA